MNAKETSLMTEEDLADLEKSVKLLEYTSFMIKVTNSLGKPLEKIRFPPFVQGFIKSAARKAISVAVEVSGKKIGKVDTELSHKSLATVSGGVGGFFGLWGLVPDLVVSTLVMLRSITAIAYDEGEPVDNIETKLECIKVFAMGGNTELDDAVDSAYYTVRSSFAAITPEILLKIPSVLTKGTQVLTQRVAEGSMPKIVGRLTETEISQKAVQYLVRLIEQISAKYAAIVTEKVAAQAVPIIGALIGGSLNLLFINHYQGVARGHFTVRRLERYYGEDVVRVEYDRILQKMKLKEIL